MTVLMGKKVGVFVSGGLTASVVAHYLQEKGADVTAFWADVGQYDEPKLPAFLTDLRSNGIRVESIDLRDQISDLALEVLEMNASYEGGYWNTTGALRYLLVREMSSQMASQNLDYFSHGCVGGGNDQKRFSQYGAAFMPDIQEYLTWKDPEFLGRFQNRSDMVRYLAKDIGYDHLDGKVDFSTDSCLMGTSYESTEMESLSYDFYKTEPLMSSKPWLTNNDVSEIEVTVKNGRIVSLNGRDLSPYLVLNKANQYAGSNGVSLKSVIENRVQDTKCRGVYESPGMDLLSAALESLRQAYFDKKISKEYLSLSKDLGTLLYRGQYATEEAQSIKKSLKSLTSLLSGRVILRVYRGLIQTVAIHDMDELAHALHQKRFVDGGHIWRNADA